ncbi:hypothetical protein GCM10015535_68470 [Streptomyces gelaticus]|uniref:Uncharacterized protein n=1 Tax=Streptomyces gelaticus TaxID=285446 RepID=A0ABQ2W912_9ACTN|nr:hypothetical protein GCM10015535_68470 [Streptomyces gelaticus]
MNAFAQEIVRSAAVAGLTVAAMGGTGAAQASTSAPSGDVSVQEACPDNGQIGYGRVCTTLSSGRLFHDKTQASGPVNVKTWYEKSSGGTITAKLGFNYAGTTTGVRRSVRHRARPRVPRGTAIGLRTATPHHRAAASDRTGSIPDAFGHLLSFRPSPAPRLMRGGVLPL